MNKAARTPWEKARNGAYSASCLNAQENARAIRTSLPSSSSIWRRASKRNRPRITRTQPPSLWVGLVASRGARREQTVLRQTNENRLLKGRRLPGGANHRMADPSTADFNSFCALAGLPAGIPVKPGTVWEQLWQRCHGRAVNRYAAQCKQPDARLELGFALEPEFNAWAATFDGVDFIGINIGVYFILRDLFDRMLSNPNILKGVGDITAEDPQPAPYADIDKVDQSSPPQAHPYRPKDPVRAKYSTDLMLLGFDFIFQHELGHIFNGHTDWLNKNLGFRALAEVGAASIPGLSGLDLQTLEMDADCFAAQDGLNRTWGAQRNPDPSITTPVYLEKLPLGSRREATFTAMFSYYCVWRLFSEETHGEVDQILKEDHPPAAYRQRYILGLAGEIALKQEILTKEEFAQTFGDCATEAEKGFTALTGVPVNKAIHGPDTWTKSGELLNRLTTNWRIIRPQLLPLVRGGNLAP